MSRNKVLDRETTAAGSYFQEPEDAARLRACGVDAVLVGEALMRREVTIEQLKR